MSRRFFAIAVLVGTVQLGTAVAQPISVAPGIDLSIAPNVDAATGQTGYNVRTLDFDLWCQQTQRYEIDRCNARRPEDVKAFEDYRTAVERYELDYLKQQQRYDEFRARTTQDPLQNVQSKQDGIP